MDDDGDDVLFVINVFPKFMYLCCCSNNALKSLSQVKRLSHAYGGHSRAGGRKNK